MNRISQSGVILFESVDGWVMSCSIDGNPRCVCVTKRVGYCLGDIQPQYYGVN